MNEYDRSRLRRNPIFARLTDAQCADAFSRLPYSAADHTPGELLHLQGERYERLLVLLAGSASAELCSPSGQTLQVETLTAPEAVASSMLFTETRRLPVTLRAETPVRLFSTPRGALLALCERYPAVIEPLLEDLGHRTAFLADRLRMSQFETLRQRLAHYLLERCDGSGRVELAETKKHLAERLGVARASLFRVIAELEDAGVIQVSRRAVAVDRKRLAEVAELEAEGCSE